MGLDMLVYVVVLHNPTNKNFCLNRKYELLRESVVMTENDLRAAAVQIDSGWFPTGYEQSPEWAKQYPAGEFTAYWCEVKGSRKKIKESVFHSVS